MREFKSLSPEGLPEGFDAEIQTEEPIVRVTESKGKITLSYIFPGFYLSEDSRDVNGKILAFKQCNIAKVGFLSESGTPLLPSFGRYVQIPYDSEFTFTVTKGKAVQFDDVLILPSQEKLTDSPADEHAFEYDSTFYARDEWYPRELVDISGPFEIDGYNALLVHVRPFQYNPKKRKLVGYGNISIDITVRVGMAKTDRLVPYDPGLNREGFGNLFLNPGRRIEERLEVARELVPVGPAVPVKPVKPVPIVTGPEFLIIYHETFKSAAEALALWKTKRGLITETVPISSIGNDVAKIKDYIRNRRRFRFSRLRYVLLFGDVDMIASEPIGDVITDYYYSTATDATGTTYVLPWLSVGRIPVRTAAEGMSVVDEIMRYEKIPPTDPAYYKRMVFGAFFQDDSPQDKKDDRCYMKTMEDIRDYMITLGFTVERVYVSNNPDPVTYCDGTAVSPQVKAAIVDGATATQKMIAATTKGYLIVGHRDHGNWDGWSHPSFTVNHLNSVTGQVPNMFFSINCLTGQFDLAPPTESFAEKLLRMKGGAPSLIAATRVSGTWRNHSLIRALFDAVWAGVLPTFPGTTASYPVKHRRLGDILNYGKSYLPVKHSGETAGIKNHFEIYHVVGDPTLELWNARPLALDVKASIVEGYLIIQLPFVPKDCVITIWLKDKMVKRTEPSSTVMKLKVEEFGLFPVRPPLMPPAVTICAWAPGYLYKEIGVKP